MEFRHEWKHEIGFADLFALRSRLSAVMKRDAHASHGRYQIRSLYFDNLSDRALRENWTAWTGGKSSGSDITTETRLLSCWRRNVK